MMRFLLLTTLPLVALFAPSCAGTSVYTGAVHSVYDTGIASEATDNQDGAELGILIGTGSLVADIGARSDIGSNRRPSTLVENTQNVGRLGARLYAPRDWVLVPYVGAGVAYQRNTFQTSAYRHTDSSWGAYWRIGTEFSLGEGLALDFAYESATLEDATIGGREGLDLHNDVLLFGIRYQF